MTTWYSEDLPERVPVSPSGWVRVSLRAPILAITVFGGLGVLLLLRMVERPLAGHARPVTPWITQGVCRAALAILGLRYRITGAAMRVPGAMVANHASWIDIFALNASARIYFVSKDEVAGWPGIGWLARATGTVFIRRDRREAERQKEVFRERLVAGHRLVFFPEGTSTDGQRVLAFKTALFDAFFSPDLRRVAHIQPISIIYTAPAGRDRRVYGWWGDMEFGASLLQIMAMDRQGRIDVIRHAPIAVADHGDRKALARAAEVAVRRGLESRLSR